ncbi:MAG: hypothetical protein PUG16_02425 [Lachnospiraceae bacterium]|nr:hypothetical protein [Lachnospiraceae bacterium]
MKKVRQILAILGIIVLVGMYAFTLFAALTDNPKTMHILGLSIVLTILIPALIWIFGVFIRIRKK